MKIINKEDEKGKYQLLKMEKFFAICELCGCIEWVDANGNGNGLEDDGEMLDNQDIFEALNTGIFCFECENPLNPIKFSNVRKTQRKKIAKMREITRIRWIKSLKILKKIERDNEKFK